MNLFRRLFHPLITFIGIQIVWIVLLVLWIYWFLGRHQQLKDLAQTYQAELLPQTGDWLILTEGIVLLVAILIGIYVIFIYWRRQATLNKAQKTFINQVTHELKSPLASIQLHLETIQLRQPDAEKLQEFIQRMQIDSDRLDSLINNLLTANRIEHKATRLNLQRENLSRTIDNWVKREWNNFPAKGSLTWEIEPHLNAKLETDAFETVLRNLLENAILYADGNPTVKVSLYRDGNMAHLKFADQGKGIPVKYQKKVFRIFYRIRHSGRTIRGSGLGLFIVSNVIRLHGGKVWIESTGSGTGTTFHLLIPLLQPERSND